jgi:hypothetical protein
MIYPISEKHPKIGGNESTQMRTSEKSEREEWVSAYITDFCRLHGKGF